MPRPIRVLIVDDHDLFRTGLRALLEEEGFEVADSASGPAAVRRAPSFAPDVVVMDMNMPGMSGVEATPLVLEAAPLTSVLMLTIATDDTRVVDAVRAGASGYLLKDAELAEIAAGIRAAAAGHCAIAPRIASALLQSVRSSDGAPARRRAARAGPICRSASGRCSASSATAVTTRRSPPGCISARARSRTTSPSCSRSSRVDNRVQAATFAVRHGLGRR